MNTFGRIFRVSIFGESHGAQVGVVIDGCPAGIALTDSDFTADLQRRKSGAKGTTPRIEADEPEIVSGVFDGHTTGTPITILFKNANTHSSDYSNLVAQPSWSRRFHRPLQVQRFQRLPWRRAFLGA